jgi:hypothetical protein
MNLNKKVYKITLQFIGGESDREIFFTRLNEMEKVEALVYKKPTPAEEWVYSHASSADVVVTSIIMIITLAGSIAEIASLIYEFLKDRAKKKEIDRQIMAVCFSGKIPKGVGEVLHGKVPNKVLVKSNSKEVEISGDFSKDEIIEILSTIGERTTLEEASKWFQRQNTELAIQKIEQELEPIEKALPEYRKLLELYEKDEKLESWQKTDYRRHKERMEALEKKAEQLRKRLKQLNKESREAQD